MGNSGGPFGTRRQARLANRFGLLVVVFMAFSAVFSMAGGPSPVAVAQQECAEGEVLNDDTGACESAGDVAPPDCADGEVLNPFTGLCESAVDAAPPECAADEMLNEDTGECLPMVDAPQPGCADGEVLNEDTGACEIVAEEASLECMDGEELNEDTGACEPIDDTTGDGVVDISTFACPSGFTGAESNSDDFGSMCTEAMSDVTFEAYDSVGLVGGGSTNAGGYLQISELGAGQVSIVEAIPDGYGVPYVFCASGDDPNSLGGFEGYEVIDGMYATIDFGSAAYYACIWYNIPEGDAGGITIAKYDCPAGYVSPDGRVSGLRTNCVDPQDGVVFDLSNGNGYAASGETGAETAGTLSFNDLQLGSYTLTERIPEGYGTPSVLCGYPADPNDDGPLNTVVAAAAGGAWNLEYTRPGRLHCEWFNIPSPDSGIDISKWNCPAGYDPADVLYETLLEDCTQNQDGVGFSLGNGPEIYDSGMSGDDGPGRLTFEEYQPGALVITETIPEGYGTPSVYCSFDLDDAPPVGNDVSVLGGIQIMDVAADGSISTQIGENQRYVCNWFNFPSSDYDIVISKYVCPAGYAPQAFEYGPLLAECTGETRDGVVFHLGDQTQATGEVIPGGVAFDDYEPGDLVIREEVPAGYAAYVFCGQSSGGVALDQMTPVPMLLTPAEDGSITVNLPENSRLVCYWYNVLTDNSGIDQGEPAGAIDIFKTECPPGFSGDKLLARQNLLDVLRSTCTEPMGGVSFEAYDDPGAFVSGGATDAGGYLNIRELPLGQGWIGESIPDGYGTPYVFCFDDAAGEYSQWGVGEHSFITSDLRFIAIDFNAANYYSCNWYNVPSDASGIDQGEPTGSIDIFRFECPPGYAGDAITQRELHNDLRSMCIEPMGGVSIEAYDDQGAFVGGGATDVRGYLNIRELPLGGLITIVEPNTDRFRSETIFCFDDSSGEYETYSIHPDLTGTNIDFNEANYYSCFWLLLPPAETTVPGSTPGVVDEVDEEEEPGSIRGLTIQHFACDPGLDPRLNQGRYTLLQLCVGAAKPAFVYHVSVDQALIESVGLQTAANTWGEVFLPAPQQEPIPAGLVTITVEPPAGYAGARVSCLQSRTDDSSEEFEPNLINGTSIMVNVGPGESLVCEWFNAPEDPGIDISAWICPAGYDATDVTLVPYAVLLQDCAQPHDGVEFSLGIPMGAYSFGFTGEDGPGHLRFEDYNPGALVITETIPEGYGTPRAFCSFDYEPSSGLVNVSDSRDGSISPDGGIPENSLLTCDFFNFPRAGATGATGAIDMFRFECPPGFTPDLSVVNDAMSMCAEPLGGVDFEVSNEQGVVGGGSTDADGYLSIRELPLGSRLSIADLDTDGYDGSTADVDDLPYVFCFDDSVVSDQGVGAYVQHFIVAGEFMTVEIDLNNVSNYSSCLWLSIAGD